MTQATDDRRILLGQITGAHGIRGDVIVRTFTADPDGIAAYGALTDKDGFNPLFIKIIRVSDKGVIARVKGVSDRNGAEALRGRELYVQRAQLPEADEAEYYHADLIGLAAVTADGAAFGTVIAVQNYGAGDLLEIRTRDGRDSEFIPFTNACVPVVDIKAKTLTVLPPVMTGEPEPDQGPTADDDATDAEP
ncbi:MAG TPA: ribosome maturation factor RimM [Hyphomicrobium sp.]|nr:ribosome maturation factor RimM [Hyphomicrobium sp.]